VLSVVVSLPRSVGGAFPENHNDEEKTPRTMPGSILAGEVTLGCARIRYAPIAKAGVTFLSRGDNSGTHKREVTIWKRAGVVPSGDWYVVTEDFMLATLRKANERKAYFMTDSSTWVSAHAELDNLDVLFRGDPVLVNVYHALCQPEGATEGQPHASKFVDFLSSDEAQAIVRNYGKDRYGEPMYCDARFRLEHVVRRYRTVRSTGTIEALRVPTL